MSTTTSEAHILVTLPSATLTSSTSGTFTGPLALEYVTFDIPTTAAVTTPTRDVLLILRIGSAFEVPLDPARALTVSTLASGAARRYTFHATRDDAEFSVELPVSSGSVDNDDDDDNELFHSVLVGYAADARGPGDGSDSSGRLPVRQQFAGSAAAARRGAATAVAEEWEKATAGNEGEDLRGRFVLMNEDDGQIVGTLDRSVRVFEDPSLGEKGHEEDPVVVELPEDADTLDRLRDAEVLVRAVPPEDRDWMVRGAVFVSHAISGTTTLLTSAMATASNVYIVNSTPVSAATTTTTTAAPPKPGATPARDPPPPPPPSRMLLLLQSSTTRKNLTRIHTVSGGAVKLSNKATAAVETVIQRVADRGKDKSGRATPSLGVPTPQRRTMSPSPTPPPPPPPQLPPRSNNRPSPSPSGSRAPSPAPPPPPPPTRTRVALSAAIILAALEASTVRLVEAGGAAVTAAVSHKYGATAGDNAALAAHTMRNIVLVYVDVHGLGRRAVVKRVAKAWVKGQVPRTREGAALQKK